jgi:hypothetical protein
LKRREKVMREWKEIGGLLLTDSGVNLLMRANVFSQEGAQVKSIDVLLRPDEVYELYTVLKSKLEAAIKDKLCVVCKYHGCYSCQHPNKEVRGYECNKEGWKYFEPKFQL